MFEVLFYNTGGVVAERVEACTHANALKVVANKNPETFAFCLIRRVEPSVSSCMDAFGDYEYSR